MTLYESWWGRVLDDLLSEQHSSSLTYLEILERTLMIGLESDLIVLLPSETLITIWMLRKKMYLRITISVHQLLHVNLNNMVTCLAQMLLMTYEIIWLWRIILTTVTLRELLLNIALSLLNDFRGESNRYRQTHQSLSLKVLWNDDLEIELSWMLTLDKDCTKEDNLQSEVEPHEKLYHLIEFKRSLTLSLRTLWVSLN